MEAAVVLVRLEPALGPPVLCGLHGLASRLALELVDAVRDRRCRLVARCKPVLDALGAVAATLATDQRQTRDDGLALAEMLARLVLDFEHAPLAHAHLVLLSERILPFLPSVTVIGRGSLL
mmetsp:Transcript_3762/g.11638  ORF Transcript_3762/g.11638 Transcript_3762/m.11638 type:complete len:121 (+) Transcript_3762:497-859(+)